MDTLTAHRLGHLIEWLHAKDRAEMLSRGRAKFTPESQFDDLAATCLGDLILTVARGGKLSSHKAADRAGG